MAASSWASFSAVAWRSAIRFGSDAGSIIPRLDRGSETATKASHTQHAGTIWAHHLVTYQFNRYVWLASDSQSDAPSAAPPGSRLRARLAATTPGLGCPPGLVTGSSPCDT